jgi:hypothetical protein
MEASMRIDWDFDGQPVTVREVFEMVLIGLGFWALIALILVL